MKFIIVHKRATMGNDLAVTVVAEGDETLGHVACDYDGFQLSSEAMPDGVTYYERSFSQVGTAAPRQDHRLVARAANRSGRQQVAIHAWADTT